MWLFELLKLNHLVKANNKSHTRLRFEHNGNMHKLQKTDSVREETIVRVKEVYYFNHTLVL